MNKNDYHTLVQTEQEALQTLYRELDVLRSDGKEMTFPEAQDASDTIKALKDRIWEAEQRYHKALARLEQMG